MMMIIGQSRLHTLELELGRVASRRDCNIAFFEHHFDELCTEAGRGACDEEDAGTHFKCLEISENVDGRNAE